MKSKLFVAVLTLGLIVVGAAPAFAAKGAKSHITATQQTTGGKHKHHHRHLKTHKKLTKSEKKAIKHAVRKSQKHQKHQPQKLNRSLPKLRERKIESFA